MKKLWIIAASMVSAGIIMVLGGAAAGVSPIILVCGVLLIWSGIVKVVVLRVWRSTLTMPPTPEPGRANARPTAVLRQQQ